MNTEGWGEAVSEGLAEGMRRAEEWRRSPHNPWPDGVVSALDMPEPEPRTALARWDDAEASTGRQLQPLAEDQSRFCLHPTADHGFLGCNTCGCPRSEDDHLGDLCRWPAHEEAGSPEPWFWRPGMHTDRYPHGMVLQPIKAGPETFRAWTGSVADLMGEPRNNVATLAPLNAHGVPQDDGLELVGPFHTRHEDGRTVEFVAWGGVSRDPLAEARIVRAQSMTLTPLDEDGNPTGPARLITGMRDAIVSFTPVVEEAAVALGHLGRAAITLSMDLKRFAFSRLWNAFYVADRILVWTRDGRRVWVHRSWVRPQRAWGVTRRQRAAQRRIRRRGTR